MKVRPGQRRFYLKTFILIGFILVSTVKTWGQITLADKPLNFKPTEFYIIEVTDERPDKNPIAELPVKDQSGKLTTKKVDLQGGAPAALKQYLLKNLPSDKSLRAIVLGIKALKVTESEAADGLIDGRIKLQLSFGLKKDYGSLPLFSSQFGLNYRRPVNATNHVETHIVSILKTSLSFFDNWMKTNADEDLRLAKNVKISFSDYRDEIEGDTIYWRPERRLTWEDFRSTNMQSNKYEALVIPSIGYNQEAKIKNGTIYVDIAMKAYLPKSAAWVRPGGKNDYTLNHEQRHFDIVKIIAEQFKQKVLAEKLSPDTYEAFINMQYLDSFRDMDKMQKAYDKETAHGMNQAAQAAWDDKIDKELKLRYLARAPSDKRSK